MGKEIRLLITISIWVMLTNSAISQDVSGFRIGASINQKLTYSNKIEIEPNSHLPNVDLSLMVGEIDYTLSIGEYSAIRATYNADKAYFRIQYEISTKQIFTNEYMQHGFGFGAGFNKYFDNKNIRLSIGSSLSYLYIDCKTTMLVVSPLQIGVSVKLNRNG